MITPPFLYGTIGIVGICISSVLYVKREVFMSANPSKKKKKGSKKNKGKERKEAYRFKRSKS
jgi:hypothetical protein